MRKTKTISVKHTQKPYNEIDVEGYDTLYIEGYDFPLPSDSSKQLKPPMNWDDLVSKLRSHGVTISDDDSAKTFILKTNYYKLSVFVRYLNATEKTVEHLIDLYDFDRFISENIFKLITPIEIYLKSTFANFLSMDVYNDLDGYKDNRIHPSLIYLNTRIYKKDKLKREHPQMISNFSEELHKKIGKDLTIDHHIEKYGGNIPIWVLIEHITLGQFGTFVTTIDRQIIKKWVEDYVETSWQKAISEWINTIRILRNASAHNDRFYARYFTYSPILPEEMKSLMKYDENSEYYSEFEKVKNTLFSGLLIIKCFYEQFDESEVKIWNKFLDELEDRIKDHPNIHIEQMGMPLNWKPLLMVNNYL